MDVKMWRTILVGLSLATTAYLCLIAWLLYPWYVEDVLVFVGRALTISGIAFLLSRHRASHKSSISYWIAIITPTIIALLWLAFGSKGECFTRSFWIYVDFGETTPGRWWMSQVGPVTAVSIVVALALVMYYRKRLAMSNKALQATAGPAGS